MNPPHPSPLPVSLPPGRILGIESSCDETAAAIVENGRVVLSSLIASQVELHARFGGVFPEVASRQHIRTIYPIIDEALRTAHLEIGDLDAIAVTRGPGLPGSLVVGVNTAKGMALASGKSFLGINHLEAHIYSAWLDWPPLSVGEQRELKPAPQFPLVVLIVSGGHTELVVMRDHLKYERLGATLDDAAGEAFDKVARLLELGYPGGPAIQEAAEKWDGPGYEYNFPRSWLEGTWNFSFSGLKTAVLRQVRKVQADARLTQDAGLDSEKKFLKPDSGLQPAIPVELQASVAASFQAAVVEVLFEKTVRAARSFEARRFWLLGAFLPTKR